MGIGRGWIRHGGLEGEDMQRDDWNCGAARECDVKKLVQWKVPGIYEGDPSEDSY